MNATSIYFMSNFKLGEYKCSYLLILTNNQVMYKREWPDTSAFKSRTEQFACCFCIPNLKIISQLLQELS